MNCQWGITLNVQQVSLTTIEPSGRIEIISISTFSSQAVAQTINKPFNKQTINNKPLKDNKAWSFIFIASIWRHLNSQNVYRRTRRSRALWWSLRKIMTSDPYNNNEQTTTSHLWSLLEYYSVPKAKKNPLIYIYVPQCHYIQLICHFV